VEKLAVILFRSIAASVLLLSVGVRPGRTAQEGKPDIEAADTLFKAGKFAAAQTEYARVIGRDPRNYRATSRLGYIALLSNRLDEAQKRLEQAIAIKPDETAAKALLAEVFYRRDDFPTAALLLRAIGQQVKATKWESFKHVKPYAVDGKSSRTVLKFIVTDPLPVLRVRVNGGEEVNFFIDTGAGEVILDSDFAKQVRAKEFGSQTGSFAGGKRAPIQQGSIDSLTLGDFVVKNVPVQIMNTRQFSKPIFGGRQVDGIIGTVLLYHFLSTLDYPRGQLVLRRNTPDDLERFVVGSRADHAIVMPFWMAGDHFMVAWGTVEKSDPVLLFVDTGLAGGGVTLAKSVLDQAGIKLAEDRTHEGLGGGGKVKVTPFVVRELSLGEAKEENVRGLFTGPFSLETSMGFRIGGIISHGFFRPYALSFDFKEMRLFLSKGVRKAGSNSTD
jgi:predicted aspartyl protease/Tfp pilus assembly protein PilF